jgi:uncharacterized repeat protein (TIGR02543 family)
MRYGRALVLASLAALAPACGGGASGGGNSVTYTLTVTVSGGGSVTGNPAGISCSSGSCSSSLPSGTQITLSAAPAAGYVFSGWSGACSGGTCSLTLTSNQSLTATFTPNALSGANVVPLTLNGATCGSGGDTYVNKPCVRVTVCLPGTSTCTLVDDVLLDTGSYGLRIFKQVLPFSLPFATAGSATIAACIQYIDGSSDWGPVAMADVVLGGEPAIRVPIQVVDATFGPVPSSCPSPETSPATVGYQGILGVGPFAEDCGPDCAASAANGIYFACSGGACSGTTVPLSSQLPNPVARLPADNNGAIVDLPPVPVGGGLSAEGSLILGIDTQANNSSAGATAYPGDPATGDIRTSFDGATIGGFLDTGSNGLFFPPPGAGAVDLRRTQCLLVLPGADHQPLRQQRRNGRLAERLGLLLDRERVEPLRHGQRRIPRARGPRGSGFDFGVPFFLGQKVYVGIAGKASSFGTGPYFAY